MALVCGIDPVLFAVAGVGLPWGMSEYDFAGHIQKSPVEVIHGEMTGLPIPAAAEIVLEGEIPPPEVESEMEGPFGEWTGYYASGTRPSPLIRIKSVYHRNDPILTVLPDFKSYPLSSYLFLVFCAAGLWNEIEQAGITDIKGVWLAEWGMRFFQVISLKQRYGGHARQAAHIALGAREGGYLGRFVVLVDDDIDPVEHGRRHVGGMHPLRSKDRLSRSRVIAGAAPSIRGLRRSSAAPAISPTRGR